eukprot:6126850-Alexandrium_andersonii.AAC.1
MGCCTAAAGAQRLRARPRSGSGTAPAARLRPGLPPLRPLKAGPPGGWPSGTPLWLLARRMPRRLLRCPAWPSGGCVAPDSYTHLTLPTICSV